MIGQRLKVVSLLQAILNAGLTTCTTRIVPGIACGIQQQIVVVDKFSPGAIISTCTIVEDEESFYLDYVKKEEETQGGMK